jgi:hypothetical protein
MLFIEYVISAGQSVADQLHHAKLPKSLVQLDAKLLAHPIGGERGSGEVERRTA